MGKKPSEVAILDMGYENAELAEKGLTNIHGIDLCKKNALKSRIKRCIVYRKLEEVALGDPQNFLNHLKNKFDIVAIAGLVNNNHLDYDLFEEITLTIKQNVPAIFEANRQI